MKMIILVNDAVFINAIRLLHSVKMFAPDLSTCFIPFDDDTDLCDAFLPLFGTTKLELNYSEVNALSAALYDDCPPQQPWPRMSGKLRKLAIADLDRPVMYIDSDCVLVNQFQSFAGRMETQKFPLLYCTKSPQWIYSDIDAATVQGKSGLFSSGCLVLGDGFPNYASIHRFLVEHRVDFLNVAKKGVVDQPIFNYICDYMDIPTKSIEDVTEFSPNTTAGNKFEFFEDWTVQCGGKPVLFLHQPGNLRTDIRAKFLFDAHMLGALKWIKDRVTFDDFRKILDLQWAA